MSEYDKRHRTAGGRRTAGSDRAETRASEVQQAAGRLEEAIQDLVRGARADLAVKTADLLDETTQRLRSQGPGSRRPKYEPEPRLGDRPVRSAGLYRAVSNKKIGGVCAGFANYFGVEAWVARCVAATGLLFLPAVTFPAYWVAYFLLDDDPSVQSLRGSRRAQRRAEKMRRRSAKARRFFGTSGDQQEPHSGSSKGAHASVPDNYSPRRALRHLTTDLTAAELKLRRMEGHVTSDQYELRRQLHALDPKPDLQAT